MRLADEHGTPNGFFAQEIAAQLLAIGVTALEVGCVLRTDYAVEMLDAEKLRVAPRGSGGFTVESTTADDGDDRG